MSRVAKALANLPGEPVLLNDVDEEPATVFSAPKARVIVRWVVVVALVGLLFGLVGWSYATSSELASGIQVERTYQPTIEDISKWEKKNSTFTCPCTSMRNTIDWSAIIPQSIWEQFSDMQEPNGPAGTPQYNSFCVAHVHVSGNKPGCKVVQHDGYNTPNDYEARDAVMQQYPGSTLQAPACRAIAANLMRLNRTGLQASHLLSQMGLNNTVHNAMNDTMYRTAAQVQSTMMMLWNLDVAPYMVNPSWNGFYDGSSGGGEEPQVYATRPTATRGYGYNRVPLAAVNESDIPIDPQASFNESDIPINPQDELGPPIDYEYGDCAANNTCATEDCLLRWFSDHISGIAPNYTAFFDACKPDFCDVVVKKSLVTKVVSFLSTLGGLWGPLYMGALVLWMLLARLPCLATTGGAHAPDVESRVCK